MEPSRRSRAANADHHFERVCSSPKGTNTSYISTQNVQQPEDQSRVLIDPFSDPEPEDGYADHSASCTEDTSDATSITSPLVANAPMNQAACGAKDGLDPVSTVRTHSSQVTPVNTSVALPRQYFAKDSWSNGIPGVWAINNDIPGHYIPKCSAAYQIIFPSNVYHRVRVTQKPWRNVKNLPEILYLSSTNPQHFAYEPFLILQSLDLGSTAQASSEGDRLHPTFSKLLPLTSRKLEFSHKSLENVMTDILYGYLETVKRGAKIVQNRRTYEAKYPHDFVQWLLSQTAAMKEAGFLGCQRDIARAEFAVARAKDLCTWLSMVGQGNVDAEGLKAEVVMWEQVIKRLSETSRGLYG
ncbi:hypothetical protein Tdes44962_MAKER00425 [Teratosphaeria destructans]|uniref:Uncharacterized protein n=1 Tax=Teratosphaeria destructans TaxID=418781 RepID=A0A9W7SSC2_9PEZI|nr:hypothetical protein Tdes44962_MAKER00425 [Teratosphaeria destructans]